MSPTRVTTETDIPAVFHAEMAEVAEVGTAVGVGEGVAACFQEGVSDASVGCSEDESVGVPGGVDRAAAGSVGGEKVWVREGEDTKVNETIDDEEVLVLVVGLPFGGNRTSPRSGERVLVVVMVESWGTRGVSIGMLAVVGR